jgi:hypothetical protein
MENRGLEALQAPPKREKHKIHKVLFIDKIKCTARSGVRSNAGCAFERTRACIYSSVRAFGRAFERTRACVYSSGRAFGRSCNAMPRVSECRRCVRPH